MIFKWKSINEVQALDVCMPISPQNPNFNIVNQPDRDTQIFDDFQLIFEVINDFWLKINQYWIPIKVFAIDFNEPTQFIGVGGVGAQWSIVVWSQALY